MSGLPLRWTSCRTPPLCSGTSAVTRVSEYTHPPCPWRHRYRRQRDHPVPSPLPSWYGLDALATIRVEEDTGFVPCSLSGSLWPSSTQIPQPAARSHILANFSDTAGVTKQSSPRPNPCLHGSGPDIEAIAAEVVFLDGAPLPTHVQTIEVVACTNSAPACAESSREFDPAEWC